MSGLAFANFGAKDSRAVIVDLTFSRSAGEPTVGRNIGAWGEKQANVITSANYEFIRIYESILIILLNVTPFLPKLIKIANFNPANFKYSNTWLIFVKEK